VARTAIQPPGMPDPRPRYTHAWRVNDTVYVAGQLATDGEGNLVAPNDIRGQARAAFENIGRVLEAAGGSLKDVVRMTVFITDMRHREGYHEARQQFYPADPPASTLVQIVALAVPGALIEIEATAVIDAGR
jgi:2-iminobutanoate/2-iminopropanoate deaminase